MQRRERRVLGVVLLAVLVPLAGGSPAWAQEPFDYFRNSWSVVGLKDYRAGARITPDNKIQLAGNVITLRFGRDLAALSRKQTKRLMDGWLPIVLISASDGAVRYDFTLWATPLPNVKDWQAAFDWPGEGENFLVWVQARATNGGAEAAEAKVAVQPGRSAGLSPQTMTWPLAPGQSAEGVVRLPFTADAAATGFDKEDAGLWLGRTAASWRNLLAKGARIQVPCEKAASALLAAHVCQLIANDRGELHAGEGFYDEFYIRDGAYQVMELEEAGLTDASRKALEFYLAAQRPDGRFETQKNQFDANGQAIWTLWQFHKITGDRAWLARAYPQMRKAVDWAMRARRQAPADSAWAGLLPPAPADGENLWDGKHHIVGYDLWNLRGMLCTADAAAILGKKDDAERLAREAAEYRAAIEAAWKKTGLAHFPPSWEKDGTHWGDTETLWPTELFPPDDPRVAASIDEVRHRFAGGFAEGTLRWTGQPDVIHPYMSAYTTMASLARGEHALLLGPTGSGKSTAAAGLARRLGARHLDTGAMYRALTLKALERGIDLEDPRALAALAESTEVDLRGEPGALTVWLDGRDVTGAIRENRVSVHSHYLARTAEVRRVLVEKQRAFAARAGSTVTEGRDQGTVVFPGAEVKFFLDAAPEVRARRRQLELQERGEYKAYREVLAEVAERDRRDSTRPVDPLRPAEGAIRIDTTDVTIDEMVDVLADEVRRRAEEAP
jgi:cytidylate kinase